MIEKGAWKSVYEHIIDRVRSFFFVIWLFVHQPSTILLSTGCKDEEALPLPLKKLNFDLFLVCKWGVEILCNLIDRFINLDRANYIFFYKKKIKSRHKLISIILIYQKMKSGRSFYFTTVIPPLPCWLILHMYIVNFVEREGE